MAAVGDILEGTVIRVYPKYAILLFEDGETGLLHISELSNSFVRNFSSYVKAGTIYRVKVIEIDEEKGFMKVSRRKLSGQERHQSMDRKAIPESDQSFQAIEETLPSWVKEETERLNAEEE